MSAQGTYRFYSVQRQTILLVNGEPLGRERVNDVKNYVPINPLTAEWALRALTDFTLSNTRRFYSSMGNLLDGKGLTGKVFSGVKKCSPKMKYLTDLAIIIITWCMRKTDSDRYSLIKGQGQLSANIIAGRRGGRNHEQWFYPSCIWQEISLVFDCMHYITK